MKTLLLIGGAMLLLYSCVDTPNPKAEESFSDDEMKNRVEVEEVEFELAPLLPSAVKDDPSTGSGREIERLKDSTNAHDLIDGEDDNSSLGKMKDEVPKLPSPPHGCPRPIPNENGVIDFPDIDAQYPGGVQEMKVFIADNLIYPDNIYSYEGTVYVSFIVEADGCLTHRKVIRGISKELDDEALRVVRAMPKWIPAQNNGENVASRLRLPITFTLN